MDSHWSEKKVHEMTERDWRIFRHVGQPPAPPCLRNLPACPLTSRSQAELCSLCCTALRCPAAFREDFNISYKGVNPTLPIRNWEEANLPTSLVKSIERAGYKKPSPIQMAAIPLGLTFRDVIGIAGAQRSSVVQVGAIVNCCMPCCRAPSLQPFHTHLPYCLLPMLQRLAPAKRRPLCCPCLSTSRSSRPCWATRRSRRRGRTPWCWRPRASWRSRYAAALPRRCIRERSAVGVTLLGWRHASPSVNDWRCCCLQVQIEEEARSMAHFTNFRVVSVVGGQSIEDQGVLLRYYAPLVAGCHLCCQLSAPQ